MAEGTEKRNPAIELTLNQQSLAPLLAKNQAERLALAARWNADSLPGRLPVELIYEVLKICAEFGWTYVYRWIRVTHFCRRWRHIALSTPALWTTIYITHTPLVKLFLKRSGSLLLDVRGRASFDFLEERQGVKNCRNIVGASQRIRSFHLSVDDSDYIYDPGEFFNLGRPNYPHLRSLEIDFRLGRSCDVPKMVSDGETMPALEYLALE